MTNQRLGVALSGGGFRAAFFHIGVLARMAELDLLRQVESLSTVSGGSIIGVLYYLRLKQLLETKTDNEITQQHYLKLVAGIEQEFLTAVQKNLRMRTFSNIWQNLKMSMPGYSRSDRIGELYDRHIFRNAWKEPRDTPIMMKELKIFPKIAEGELASRFNPTKGDNDNREHKVPVLNINATVLNTGHDWRFTAVDMGEVVHASTLEKDIDKNTRLIRGRYEDICRREKGFPLGKAVAASAGVPGIFPPLSVSDMYAPIRKGEKTRVQLVDGGVYDNQGIEALLNDNFPCDRLVISDASGQMRDLSNPNTGTLAVFMRTTDVLMGRVREEMIGKAVSKNGTGNVGLLHMTEGLPIRFQHPRGNDCQDHIGPRDNVHDPVPRLQQDMRGRLSRVRTDLDSFTDVESNCLMAHGYALACTKVDAIAQTWGNTHVEPGSWRFTRVSRWLEDPAQGPATLEKQLDASQQKIGKAFRLALNKLPAFLLALALFLAGLAIMLAVLYLAAKQFTPDPLAAVYDWLKSYTAVDLIKLAVVLVGLHLLGKAGEVWKYLSYAASFHRLVSRVIISAIVPSILAIPVKLYLWTLDRYYLWQGRIKA